MTAKRGMSINVARSMGYIKSKPKEEAPVIIDLPCQYGNVWHQGGLSSKDLFLLAKNHQKVVHGEYRL